MTVDARRRAPLLAAVAIAFLFAAPPPAGGHESHGGPPGKALPRDAAAPAPSGVPLRQDEEAQRRYFTDLRLLDQDGREVRFYTDVLKDRLVLVSFIYTNCTDACPLLMANLSEAKSLLGARMGRDVRFVSISVDPGNDTPEELKKYAERWNAGPGWTFLTGRKDRIDWVVYKLGQYAPDVVDHSTLFLLGDVKYGRWSRMRGDLPPESIVEGINNLLLKRAAGE